jgi:tRNA(Ile)-lysidine synthase
MSTKLDHIKNQKWDVALLAVSGGVDSIVLLHLLASAGSNIEAAYIDHSQRDDTALDILAIKELTDKHKIKLHISKLNLPPVCSEQLARKERYKALNQIMQERGLNHIITAHHADDVIETAVINLIRGTGPRGLSSLRHQPQGIWRPFLFDFQNNTYILKNDLLDYAKQHQLRWNEDSTNQSADYLRNRIRQKLKSSNKNDLLKLLKIISSNSQTIDQIDQEVKHLDLVLTDPTDQGYYKIEAFKLLPEEIKDQFLYQKISEYGYDVNKDAVKRAKEFVQTKTTGKILELPPA